MQTLAVSDFLNSHFSYVSWTAEVEAHSSLRSHPFILKRYFLWLSHQSAGTGRARSSKFAVFMFAISAIIFHILCLAPHWRRIRLWKVYSMSTSLIYVSSKKIEVNLMGFEPRVGLRTGSNILSYFNHRFSHRSQGLLNWTSQPWCHGSQTSLNYKKVTFELYWFSGGLHQ